jgi:RNA polymerase Rpb1, domain 2
MSITEYSFKIFEPNVAKVLNLNFTLDCLNIWKKLFLKQEAKEENEIKTSYKKLLKFSYMSTRCLWCKRLIDKTDFKIFIYMNTGKVICKPTLFYVCCNKFVLFQQKPKSQCLARNLIIKNELKEKWLAIEKNLAEFSSDLNCNKHPIVVRTDANYGFYQQNLKVLKSMRSEFVILPNPIYWQLGSVFFYEKLLRCLSREHVEQKIKANSVKLLTSRSTTPNDSVAIDCQKAKDELKKLKHEFLNTNLYYGDLNTRHQGNNSIYRLNAIGKRSKNTGRCMIIPAPHIKPNEIILPRYMWVRLNRPHWVIINRMPTLLPENFTAHRVRYVWDSACLGVPCEILEGHNGDFDGDEVNVWPVQNLESIAELAFLMNPEYNMHSQTMTDHLKLAISTDCVLAIYYSTTKYKDHYPCDNWIACLYINVFRKMDDSVRPTFFTQDEIDILKRIDMESFEYPLFDTRNIEFPKFKSMTLNQCLRKCFPRHFYFKMSEYEMDDVSVKMQQNHKIYTGQILRAIYETFNSEICFYTFCNLKHFYLLVSEIISFSISPGEIDELKTIEWPNQGNGLATEDMEKIFIEKSKSIKDNFLVGQAISGVKGSFFHLYQLTHSLGSQLTIFASPNINLTNVGMTKSFYQGLTPAQYIVHTQAGTDDLLITFMDISKPGYMTTKLTNSLQNCIVGYDYKIYKNNTVVYENPVNYLHPSEFISPATIDNIIRGINPQSNRKRKVANNNESSTSLSRHGNKKMKL